MNLQSQRERLILLLERLHIENRKTQEYIGVLNPNGLNSVLLKDCDVKKSPQGLLEEINDIVGSLENEVYEKSLLNDDLDRMIFNIEESEMCVPEVCYESPKLYPRKEMKIEELEIAKPGYANGISTQLAEVLKTEHRSLTPEEKNKIIDEATIHMGNFLTALGTDWVNDPNSNNSPRRIAKAYVNDLWKGRYEVLDISTSFPSDGYEGIVLEKNIELTSMCSHHHQTIKGNVHIAYIPRKGGNVIGLSKLNRVVEHYGRRGAIQEQLTVAIHNAINKLVDNIGVMVMIDASHNCVSCRGIKHFGASMMTSEVSGVFANHEKTAKQEVLDMIKMK